MILSTRTRVLSLAALLVIAALVAPAQRSRADPQGSLVLPFSDFGEDTDGDGRFEYLVVNVTVSVASAGMFALRFELAQPVDTRVFLDVGTQVVPTRVYGWSLYNAGFDGPYTATVVLANGINLTYLDSVSYTTGAYRAADFDPPAAIVESVGTAWPVDTNGNGLYDELRLNYTLNVTGEGSWTLEGVIWASMGSYTGFIRWEATPNVGPGVHSLTFAFPGGLINASGASGRYHYFVYVTQWFTEPTYSAGYSVSWKDIYTPDYYWYQFEPPWVRMVPPFSDHGVDLDGDGLYEEIVVRVPVHLDRASDVSVDGWIGPSQLIMSGWVGPRSLPAGDTSVDLAFPAFLLNTLKMNGPYAVTVNLVASVLPGYQQTESYTTGAYDYTQMSPPSGSPGTPGWQPVDTDSDGKMDYLDVGVNVTAAKEGDYFVRGSLWTGPYTYPSMEAGRLLHLTAGATTNVTLRYSGVALNRSGLDGPWIDVIDVARLDSIPADQSGTVSTSPAYSRSQFVSLPHVPLNGTVRSLSRGTPVAYAEVLAVDPGRGFWTWVSADAFGNYSLDVYPGAFTVANLFPAVPDQSITRTVSVAGPSIQDLDLPGTPASGISWDISVSAWNVSSVTTTRNQAFANATARIAADLYGNFDGIANGTELTRWLRYPFFIPYAYPVAYPKAAGLGLSVDGRALSAGSESLTLLRGAGAYSSTQAIVGEATATFRDPAPPSAGPDHIVDVRLFYDQPGFDSNLTVTLPAGFSSTATASPNVSLYPVSALTWIVDPGLPSPPTEVFATAEIVATPLPPDTVPPVASFAAGMGERGAPVTLDGSGSTDDIGVVNYTWSLAVNGSTRTGYGPSFTTTFLEIGSYSATLTVRDAAGNANSVVHSVVVRDTQPPPTPTNVRGTAAGTAAAPVVQLTWSAVAADDLAGYTVYRSTDNGTNFTKLAAVAGGLTAFTDASVRAGSTYRYRVTAVDRYGNEAPPSTPATVALPGPVVTNPSGGFDLGLWIGVAAVAAGIAGVVALYLVRRRTRRIPPAAGEFPTKAKEENR